MEALPKLFVVPANYIEIDMTSAVVCPRGRVSTRKKFRQRRLERQMRKLLRQFTGKPINDETKRAIKAAIEDQLGSSKLWTPPAQRILGL